MTKGGKAKQNRGEQRAQERSERRQKAGEKKAARLGAREGKKSVVNSLSNESDDDDEPWPDTSSSAKNRPQRTIDSHEEVENLPPRAAQSVAQQELTHEFPLFDDTELKLGWGANRYMNEVDRLCDYMLFYDYLDHARAYLMAARTKLKAIADDEIKTFGGSSKNRSSGSQDGSVQKGSPSPVKKSRR